MKGFLYGICGNYQLIKGNRDIAISYFKKALDLNTRNVLAIYNYGLILLQDGSFDKALELFNKSLELNTKRIQKKTKTPAALNRAELLQKNIPLAIASAYWRLEKIDKAIDTLEDLRKKYAYVSPNALATLGYFYLVDKNYDKALEITNLALEDDETFYPAWDNLGQIAFEKEDLEKAEEYFKKSISLNPKSVDSLYHLGLIEEIKGDSNKALENFKNALECNITALNTVSRETIEEKIKLLDI